MNLHCLHNFSATNCNQWLDIAGSNLLQNAFQLLCSFSMPIVLVYMLLGKARLTRFLQYTVISECFIRVLHYKITVLLKSINHF